MTDASPAEAGADVFISYSRRDGDFVRRLHDALTANGRSCWVDWEGIPPSAKWMEEVRGAIGAAQAFVFVISPDSIASDVCREEIDYAASLNKRIIPIVAREPERADGVPEPATVRNWIFLREEDDFGAGLGALEETLDTDPEWAREHTRLSVRAVEWDSHDRDPSFALRGRDLTAAETWLTEADARKDPQPTQLQTEYIVASRGVATRSQRRRMAALGAALVISSALAVVAFLQFRRAEDEADIARSRELAVSANQALARNPDLARALAVESAAAADTPEAAVALRQALEATHVKAELAGPGAELISVGVDPAGTTAAAGGDDGLVTLWSLATGKQTETLDTGDEPVNTVAFDRTGNRMVLAAGKRALVWAPGDPEPSATLRGHGAKVWSAAFDRSGQRIVTAGADGTARVWTAGGRELTVFAGHPAAVFTAAFAPNGRVVASGGRTDDFIRIWNPRTGDETGRFRVRGVNVAAGQATDVNAVVFSPDGKRLLSGAGDGFGRLYDLGGGEPLELPAGEQEVYGVGFDRTGTLAAAASLDGKVRIWDVSNARRDPELTRTLLGHGGGVNGVAFAPASRDIVTASADGTARLWEARTDDAVVTLAGHERAVIGVAVTADGETAATTSLDGTARLWDVEAGDPLREIETGSDTWSPVFSPDGERLLAGVGDATARIWEVTTGEEVSRYTGHRFRVIGAALAPGGETAVTTAEQFGAGGQSWEAATGRPLASFRGHGDYVFSADLSPDGERALTSGADRTARVWDPATGEELGALEGHTDWVRDARFSPDGERIVTGSEDTTARVWDAATLEPLRVLRGHEEGLLAASFSPDGQRIATASSDTTVRVWDADSGDLLDVLRGHGDWVNDIAFTPGGEILTASSDDTAKLMACDLCLPLGELIELAEATVPYELSAAEREEYLHE